LISNDLAPKVAKQLDFENDSNISLEYPATVRFTAMQPVDQSLSSKADEYTEMDDEIATLLNMDFHLFPSKLKAILRLFTGSFMQGDENVLVLTNEVYGRNFGIDVHAEKDNETRPLRKDVNKTHDGSKSLNILITASTTISTSPIHSVGTSTNITLSAISSVSSKIYMRLINGKKFKETSNQLISTSTTTNNISRLRQVTSSLHDKAIYNMYWVTLKPFDDDLYQPATIFTLCDIPNNEGYGCSDKSYTKLMSKFLQIITTKVITNNTKFEMTDFDDAFIKFELVSSQKKKKPKTKDESNASKTFKSLMEACQRYKKEKGEQADIMKFARSYSLSSIATTASSAVSKANEEIIEYISKLLLSLFC
ncbi:hypothetical protein CU098_005714, partial [Rhizopus stolonifer]